MAVYSLTRVLDVLADTEFQIGEEARKRLWKILLTEYQIYQGVYESFGMSQYFFQAKSEVSVCEFAHFARAFHDRQAAAMYLRLAQTSSRQKASEYYREFTEQGIRPALLPDLSLIHIFRRTCGSLRPAGAFQISGGFRSAEEDLL